MRFPGSLLDKTGFPRHQSNFFSNFWFADRTTAIGGIINKYLECSTEIEDHAIHLLFSANRWELLYAFIHSLKNLFNASLKYLFTQARHEKNAV